METLEEGKQFLRDNWEKGARCPCCTQFVKIYKRRIHHTMARMLINLYLLDLKESRFYHTTEIQKELKLSGTADFAKLVYWELIEELEENQNENTKTSGFWKITEKGRLFVQNKISVPSHAKIFDARLLGFEGDQVSIKESFGKFFNYSELMKGSEPQQESLF